jgi:peptidoglycan/xylan/chitin deacetylase (PgdA/CDA1 family)
MDVAVIARPGSAALGACLHALRGEGIEPLVVEIAGDGAGQARNRALEVSTDDVLALVEDDVVVEAGWRAALDAAWGAAADDVAVIGGPLRPRFAAGRPGWLDPTLDAALAVQDLGEEPVALNPAHATFHGGNVSFRTAALRGAGGFWPARGHPRGRDWLSDEHHAQQALGAAGWRGRYEPGARAWRLAEPRARELLLSRARYGARMAALGGDGTRSRGEAARAVARAAAGLPVAVARGRRATAAARAARLAENMGVIAGGAAARRDFEPVARRTAFRPSVPPPARRTRRRRTARGALVLLYHRVAEPPRDPLGLAVAPHRFGAQLDVLGARRRLVDLAELAGRAASGDLDPACVAITFDDGYADNVRAAAPALEARGVPWTLFVSTGHVEEGRRFWWDEVVGLLDTAPASRPAELRLRIAGAPRAWRVETPAQREGAARAILAALQGLGPGEIAAAVAELRAWAGTEAGAQGGDGPMTVAELRELAARGVAIGAHTRTHRGLAYAPEAAQREEVRASRDDLERWLGRAPSAFSYPFGAPGADVDDTSIRVVREAGFACAVVNAPGAVTRRSDPLALPRVAVPDLDGPAFAEWLAAR